VSPPTDAPKSYDDLMQLMGVRRLDAPQGKPKKPARPPPAAPAPPPAAAGRPPGGPVPPPKGTPAGAAPPPTAAPPDPGLLALRAEIADLRAALVRATVAGESAMARADAAEAQHADLERRYTDVDAQRRSLQRRLEQDRGPAPRPPRTLAQLLADRGLMGPDEHEEVMDGLRGQRALRDLLPQLVPVDEQAVASVLDDRVALHGDCGACPSANGRFVLRVPRARCEVCEGSDIQRSMRRFIDALLLSGLKRVALVGGSPKYRRQLQELVPDKRVKLTLIPGDGRRFAQQARQDVDGNDLVVLWGGTILDHAVSGLYLGLADGKDKVMSVPHRGIGRMLGEVAERLGAR